MSIKFEVKMTEKYMYDYMLYHNYSHASGLLTAILGVVALGMGIKYVLASDINGSLIWFLVAIMFLIINPRSMKLRAKAQVQNTATFQKPLEYEMTEEGIVVRQDEAEATTKWEDFTKAVSTQKSVILYMGRVRAFVLPKECMGQQYEEVIKMIHTHMPPSRVKIRHIH